MNKTQEKAILEVLVDGKWLVWKEIIKQPDEQWDGRVLTQLRPITRVRIEKVEAASDQGRRP